MSSSRPRDPSVQTCVCAVRFALLAIAAFLGMYRCGDSCRGRQFDGLVLDEFGRYEAALAVTPWSYFIDDVAFLGMLCRELLLAKRPWCGIR